MTTPQSRSELDRRAEVLRQKLSPLPAEKVLAAWGGLRTPLAYSGDTPLRDCTAHLSARAVRLGTIAGDGRCQYAAFSRAAFSTDEYTDELLALAISYLRIHKAEYDESMKVYYLGERKANLTKLIKEGVVKADLDGYDAYLAALEQGKEWGNDQTLKAMAILMRLEVRVVQNLPCPPSQAAPRLLPLKVQPNSGTIDGIVYVFHEGAHYSTLENGISPPPPVVRAPTPATEYSVHSGSVHTDQDNDVTYDYEVPIRVLGEEYQAGSLCGQGESLGDGTRLVMEPSDSGTQWIIYRLYVQSGHKEEIQRRTREVVKGPDKRRALPRAARPEPEDDGPAASDDADGWLVELQQLASQGKGWQATPMVAQRLFDLLRTYKSSMDIDRRDDDDETPLGLLSTAVLDIYDELRKIKSHLAFAADKNSRPIQSALVVGCSGAGKSTMLNWAIREGLDLSGCHADPEDIVVQDDVFRDQSKVQLEASTVRDEMLALAQAREDKSVKFCYNTSSEDILTTGSGAGAMTALVNHIFIDPAARHVQLVLTYRKKEVISEVLEYAEEIHASHGAYADKDAPTDDRKAYFAAALLGLEVGHEGDGGNGADDSSVGMEDSDDEGEDEDAALDAVDLLKKHEGPFALPRRFEALYGSERRLTLKGRDEKQVIQKLQDLLLVHTIGRWSHWAVLEKVELVVPSKLRAPLRMCDVPGFGDEALDPFRQSIVDDALKTSVSTLCLVLKWERLEDSAAPAFDRLDKLGIFDDLLGEATQRRIGKLTTVVALDWAAKEFIETPNRQLAAIKECIETRHASLTSLSKRWLKSKLQNTMKAKLQCGKKMDEADKRHLKERIKEAMDANVQSLAIDVRGKLSQYQPAKSSDEPLAMGELVERLLQNNEANLQRQQEACLLRTVKQCLLPFYARLNQLCHMEELVGEGNDDRLRPARTQQLINGVRENIENNLSTSSNSQRVNKLRDDVLNPKTDACTYEAIKQRWELKEFETYSKKRSRRLGEDLKSRHPEDTLLPDLTMKPLARDAMLPLQDGLRALQKELVDDPADDLQQMVIGIMEENVNQNAERAPDREKSLQSAWALQELGFRDGIGQMKDYFHRWLETRIASLRDEFPNILHTTLDIEELGDIARDKKLGGNVKKRDELARKTIGGTGMARQLNVQLSEAVKKEVFSKICKEFTERFEKLVKYCAGMMDNALRGDVKDLEQLNGFGVSRRTAHDLAQMIKAIYESGVTPRCFEEASLASELPTILAFAQQPSGLLAQQSTDVALQSGAMPWLPSSDEPPPSTTAPALTAPAGPEEEQWCCPSCGVSAADTNMSNRSKYPLKRPRCDREAGCWCEGLAKPEDEYCQLCVRWFKQRHVQRSEKTEKGRQRGLKRRLSGADASPGKRQRGELVALQGVSASPSVQDM